MVIERAELFITPGLEADFETAMVAGRALLAGAAGCRSVSLARGIETPSKYLLLLGWDSLDDHSAFTRSAEFGEFRELAGAYFAARPAMEHFAPLDAG
jgi:heme-degrading monooxygenase HmoA